MYDQRILIDLTQNSIKITDWGNKRKKLGYKIKNNQRNIWGIQK